MQKRNSGACPDFCLVALLDMFHGVRQHTRELSLIVRFNEQRGRNEYVPTRERDWFVSRTALILRNHAKRKNKLCLGHMRGKSGSETVQILLQSRVLDHGVVPRDIGQSLCQAPLPCQARAAQPTTEQKEWKLRLI